MPSTSMLKNRGLFTFSNYFTSVPEGAMLQADNCIIDRDGIVEPRRGITDYGTVGVDTSQIVSQFGLYKTRLLTFLNNMLWFDNGSGVNTAFTTDGTTAYTFGSQGIYRQKSMEAQGNFYFTTDDGVKKLSLTNISGFVTTPGAIPIITPAGGFRSPDVSLALDLSAPNGFLPAGYTVAYRVLWGTTDANNNLILGYPSNNVQITNTSNTTSYGVVLTIEVPPALINAPFAKNYFYQIYRSPASATSPASDELNQVYEAPYDGTSIIITPIHDNTPESVRNTGTPLYSNQNSGEGASQINQPPPFCQDMTLYKNFAFYANIQQKQQLGLTLQGLDGFSVLNTFTSITYSGGSGLSTFTLSAAHDIPIGTVQKIVLFSTNGAGAQIVTATFNGTHTFTVPGDFSSITPSKLSAFTSYVQVEHGSTIDTFFFVGRPTDTTLHVGTNKETLYSFSVGTLYTFNVKQYTFTITALSTAVNAGAVYTTSNGQTFIASVNAPIGATSLVMNGTSDPPASGNLTYSSGIGQSPTIAFTKFVSADSVTAQTGDTYSDGTHTYTVTTDVGTSGTLITTGTGAPAASGSLTRTSGTGTPVIYFPAVATTTTSNASAGSVYTNNGVSFTVASTISGSATVTASGVPGPTTSGILLNTSGAGDPVINFTSNSVSLAGMVDGSGFTIADAKGFQYLFWYKLTPNSVFSTSIPANTLSVPIDISASTILTPANIVDATATAMGDTGSFYTNTSGADLFIITSDSGKVTTAPSLLVSPGAGWSITQTQDGVGEDITNKFINLSSNVSIGLSIQNTAQSFVRVIDQNIPDLSLFYTSTTVSLPGNIIIYGTDFSTPAFQFGADSSTTGSMFNPVLNPFGYTFNITAGNATAGDVYTNNSQYFTVSDTITSGIILATTGTGKPLTSGTLTKLSGAGDTTLTFSAYSINPSTTALSSAESNVNRIFYSKQYQPESVPALNYIDIGPKDKAILRIIALRNTLFILKEEGIYSITGTDPTNFYLTLFDSSTLLVAPDTAQVLNNQIYMLSSQGVATVTETGVGIISRPIENIFTRIKNSNFTNYNTASFACSYESDRAYLLFTVFNTTDVYATRVYRYNTFTQAWTSWIVSGNAAIVNPVTSVDKLYIGSSSSNTIEIERKNLSRTDYADKEYGLEIIPNSFMNGTFSVSSTANVSIGDIIRQTQYLTISQFNRLLAKLDIDGGIPAGLYQVNYSATFTNSLNNNLFNLTTYLHSVAPTVFTISSNSASFVTMQSDFNTLIGQLNGITSPSFFKDYAASTGTIEQEVLVSTFSQFINTITGLYTNPIIAGPATVFKAIPSTIIWAPVAFGDPSLLKHIREGTLMFEFDNLAQCTLGFATDLSSNFNTIPFVMEGDGSWGNNVWGGFTWGGEGGSAPFRTLIPLEKQRCRFIKTEFLHSCAFYKFSILGISYVYEPTSTRAYR